MELVVLGTGAAYPGPHQACSGYLIREGQAGLLLDCGNGIVSRLQEAGEMDNLTALVFSHLHADHLLDVFPLFYSRIYTRGKSYPRLPVYLPPGEADRFARIAEVLRVEPHKLFERAFQATEYDPAAGLMVDGLHLSFLRNEHPIPTYAVRVENSRSSLFYSSDTGPHPGLVDLARGSYLALCEATLDEVDYSPEHPIHLTPRLAAEIASQAGVQKLLLTHMWPFYDRQAMLDQARRVFPATEIAQELKRYPVP